MFFISFLAFRYFDVFVFEKKLKIRMADPIKEYCKLERQKKSLLSQKAEVDAKLAVLKEQIIEFAQQQGQNVMDVVPTGFHESIEIGPAGSLVLKSKNEYEDFNKTNLRNACLKYFRMLFPDEELANIEKFAFGQAAYMWAERESSKVLYLERTFVEPEPKKPKTAQRKKPESKPQKTTVEKEILPKTREDFFQLKVFERLSEETK